MLKCDKCGYENDPDAKYCVKCGNRFQEGADKNIIILVVALILVGIIGVAAGIISKSQIREDIPVNIEEGFPLSEVPSLAAEIERSGYNFDSVTYKGVTLDKWQCLYIFSRAIVMIHNGETGNIPIREFTPPNNPYGYVESGMLTKAEYLDMAQRTYNWMDNYASAPNFIGITTPGVPDLSPETALRIYTKILTYYNTTGELPETINF